MATLVSWHSMEHLTGNVRRHFERTAGDYDRRRFETFRDLALDAIHRWLDRCRPGGTVLEIGVGTGDLFASLHGRFGEVAGFDVSVEMARLARRRLRAARPEARGALLAADAQRIPLASMTFDGVVALDVLEHLPDPRAAVEEVVRVLRPGGLAFLTTPNPRWAFPMWLAEKLGMKVEEGPHRYLLVERLAVDPARASVEHVGYLVDWPFRILRRTGKSLLRLPFLRRFGFNQLIVIRRREAAAPIPAKAAAS